MFCDDICGTSLWPSGFDLDTDTLPLSPALRSRLEAWVTEWEDDVMGGVVPEDEWDRRGYALSKELQAEVGPDYEIVYEFASPEVRAELGSS
jgi:hypothetical protein